MECSICGISDKMRNVSQALGGKGIVFACDRCAANEGLVAVKKPKVIEEAKESVYQRMARLAGVEAKPQPERPLLRGSEEKSLRQLVDKTYEKKIEKFSKNRPDLVDNFHWMIMRVRRVKGLTQSQLADRIGEPEAAIKMAEQGVVPEGYGLVDKLEHFLKIRIIKQRNLGLHIEKQRQHLNQQLQTEKSGQESKFAPQSVEERERKLSFDKQAASSLTIADLKRMKESRREENAQGIEEDTRQEGYAAVRPYDRLDYE